MALGANGFGGEPELIAERPGECLVRPVARLERHRQDVGRAGRERLGGLGQAAAAHIAHRRMSGHRAEGPRHVEARDAAGRAISSSVMSPAKWLSMNQSAFPTGSMGASRKQG